MTAAIVSVGILCGTSSTLASIFAYDNSVNDKHRHVNPALNEVGNQVILDAGALAVSRDVVFFAFQYYLQYTGPGNLDPNFRGQAQVRFLQNDDGGKPGTVMWNSGWFDISPTADIGEVRQWVADAGTPLAANVPDEFTWTVQFKGVNGQSPGTDWTAGVFLFPPPVKGQAYDDYWMYTTSWDVYKIPGYDKNQFAAQIGVVPEPPSLAIAAVLGLGAMLYVRHARQRTPKV